MGFINLIRIFLPLSSSRCQNIYHYIILSRLFRQKKAFFFFFLVGFWAGHNGKRNANGCHEWAQTPTN